MSASILPEHRLDRPEAEYAIPGAAVEKSFLTKKDFEMLYEGGAPLERARNGYKEQR